MIRIAVPWLMSIGDKLESVDSVPDGGKVKDLFFPLYDLKVHLESLYDVAVYGFHLRTSRPKAFDLIAAIDPVISKQAEDDAVDLWKVRYEIRNFKPLFLADLSVLPIFLATMKEGYDVNLLIDAGVALFPTQMRAKAPEAIRDATEAGKALAFELGTACGFHTFRVAECVLRRYWDVVANGAERPRLQTIGNFVAELDSNNLGDAKIRESLKQLARLHRNPIIHPEVILTTEEAIGLIGMVRSVVGAMLPTLPEIPTTTSSPISVTDPESGARAEANR